MKIIAIPNAVVCPGCGYFMFQPGDFPKHSSAATMSCETTKCIYKGRLFRIPLPTLEAELLPEVVPA